MDQQELGSLKIESIKKVAIAYLLDNPQEAPEGAVKLLEKLKKYDETITEIMNAINEARNTVEQLKPKADQVMGSIETLAELISEEITEERAKEMASKYDLESFRNGNPKPRPVPVKRTQEVVSKVEPAIDADIAGASAKAYNQQNPIPAAMEK